ncbi:HAUS augmin-like complex subunit 6 N-terminus-domain-containing protein [Staphylotrichum tortipilum]|uniref:HAUS augmin-like complex subunit 6 N-terminus-domain-containing protein n=1 Tax=Staphylotrichum tortipilum TaxID=2831512 RepID=A0AAN6RPX8_9PEZI|nr:HAUS augmin-like complex subunit 6 N-terminus-domain-containing protein [Staphylotrichum longicolle]
MAHLNRTTSLTRTRSTRLPATLGKPAQISSRATPSSITASSTTPSTASHPNPSAAPAAPTSYHPPPPTASSTSSPTGPSNLSLFLTNLRLLDLDQRPDWPDITPHTFTTSTRDAAGGGQKKRVQSVEWALYHLFRLYDPEETRAKLQPFFPPLDQVQSLNLRAALLRGLEQAKKNGVLGRDAVVRKTMLDECKGDRVEEVLAVFSAAVVRKVVAEGRVGGGGYPPLAQGLALENRGYAGDRGELAALVLVHRMALRKVLEDKNAARGRYKGFSELLDQKEKDIAKRREAVEVVKRSGRGQAVSDAELREILQTVRNNWAGDERWMEALLYGDSKSHKDGVLSAPYDRVWRRVQSGRLAELEDTSSGLLEQLEHRVQGQRERLKKWQGFRQRVFGKTGSAPATKRPEPQAEPKGIDLRFTGHDKLRLGLMSPRKLPRTTARQLDSHYDALVAGLKADLARLNPTTRTAPSFFQPQPHPDRPRRRAEASDPEEEDEISEISDIEQAQPAPLRVSPSRREPIRVQEEPAFSPVLRKAKTFDEEQYEHQAYAEQPTPSRLRRSATVQSPARRRPALASPTRERRRTSAQQIPPASPPNQVSARSPEPTPSPDLPPPSSPTQQLADEILASVSAASPSPLKKRPRHTLSLAERTQLSMARRTSHANLRVPDPDDDEDGDEEDENEDGFVNDDGPDPFALKRPSLPAPMPIPIVAEPPPSPSPAPTVEHEDLVARTRRSMAGFEAARQKAQLERRRSLRKGPPVTPAGKGNRGSSYFSSVDEGVDGNSTRLLAEELMSGGGEEDYEAVFMSRPKLKTSPVGTPVRGFWGGDV